MFNLSRPTNHKEALANKHQLLTIKNPGTIGFEIEQLYYHGTCLGPIIEVESQVTNQAPRREPPHLFLEREKPNSEYEYLEYGVYGNILARSDLVDITLDTTITEKDGQGKSEIKHVLEFVTAPMTLTDALEAALKQVSNTVKDLYTYSISRHSDKSFFLKEWISLYNSKEYAIQHKMTDTFYFRPAEPVMNIDINIIEPVFCIHVNTSILLEQLYTPEMREAFPIFTDYPPIVKGAKEMGLKDWPSTRPCPGYEEWELKLTESIYQKVNNFVDNYLKRAGSDTSEHSKKRIGGYFRTILYSFCILANEEKAKAMYFREDKFETNFFKDFFLHGIAKINLNHLLINGMTTREKAVLKKLANTEYLMMNMQNLLLDILYEAAIPIDATAPINFNENSCYLTYTQYLDLVLIQPIKHEEKNVLLLPVRGLDETLPHITIDGEDVIVPVVEFRACEGNGCSLNQLEALLTTQASRAEAFAKLGFEQMQKIENKNAASRSRPL